MGFLIVVACACGAEFWSVCEARVSNDMGFCVSGRIKDRIVLCLLGLRSLRRKKGQALVFALINKT